MTLLVIVMLMRTKVPIGLSFLAGSAMLAVFFALPPRPYLVALGKGLVADESLFLMAIVVSIMTFSGALHETGQITKIIDAFKALVGQSRLTLVTFPALLGLLPMPGGAIFSAPMVKAAVHESEVSPEQATIANYWFRHIWEYWFPVYPGVVLALTLTGAPTGKFILFQLPLTFCSLAAGYVVILHRIRLGGKSERNYSRANCLQFLRELLPIIIVVGTVAVFDPVAGKVVKMLETDNILARRVPMLLGLIFATAWLFRYTPLTWATLRKLAFKKNVFSMLLLAAGIMMFKEVLQDSGAVTVLRDEFTAWNVPVIVVVCALPLVCGVVTGLAIGYVGTSFPLVIVLLSDIPADECLPYYCLAFSFGYVGMMLSPMHLCLLLTNEYFKSKLLRVYSHYLIPLSIILAAFSGALFFVYRML